MASNCVWTYQNSIDMSAGRYQSSMPAEIVADIAASEASVYHPRYKVGYHQCLMDEQSQPSTLRAFQVYKWAPYCLSLIAMQALQ